MSQIESAFQELDRVAAEHREAMDRVQRSASNLQESMRQLKLLFAVGESDPAPVSGVRLVDRGLDQLGGFGFDDPGPENAP